jgi:porin
MSISVTPFFYLAGNEGDVMKRTRMIMAADLMILLVAASAFSQGKGVSPEGMDVTKRWFEKAGISYEIAYKGEYWANTRGGLRIEQTHLHNLEISAALDTKQAGLWSYGKLFAHLLSDRGGRLLTGEIVGDSQTVSNIEAPRSTRLYQLWYEHSLLDGKLSLLLGIHDFNSEFAATEFGAFFINSSFGISKDISGGARPGIFPLAAPAIRAKLIPNKSWEFLVGVYNGDPGDPGLHKHFPRLTFDGQAGALIAVESVYHFRHETLPGTVKAGFWHNTGRFDDLMDVDHSGNPISRKGNKGFYLVADKLLFAKDDDQGLGAFLQLGWTPDRNINEFNSYIGAGFKYKGLIPRRCGDEAGIAVAHALLSDKLVSGLGRDKAETTLEISYKAVVNRYIALQPDVQFVLNPGADQSLKNAVAAGLRLEISF